MNVSKKPGFYFHIPFCHSKCGYCDFYSVVDPGLTGSDHSSANSRFSKYTSQIPLFIEALKTEIDLTARKLDKRKVFDTVYIGGGTPSILQVEQIEHVLDYLYHHFHFTSDCEVTIEINPATANLANLKKFRSAGINRISIGVQSFIDNELQYLERIHSSRQAMASIESARTAGFDNINIDLIFAIPGQTLEDWQFSLDTLMSYDPEHISIYNLSFEPGTPFYNRLQNGQLSAFNESAEEKFFRYAHDTLKNYGYLHYEVSNYAKTDSLISRHNYKYWEHTQYIGLGPSAHSFWENKRWENCKSLSEYTRKLHQQQLPQTNLEVLKHEQLIFELIFLALRTYKGLNLATFSKHFGSDFKGQYAEQIDKLLSENHAALEGDYFRLTEKGMLIYDEILPAFANV